MSDTPDLSQYVDLRLYDRDAQALFDVMIQDLQHKIPGWVPDESSTEVALLESMSVGLSESIFAINRLPGSVMVVLMQMFGITRDDGKFPTGKVKVTAVDTFGHTIPADTRFLLSNSEGIDPLVLTMPNAVVIPVGSNSAIVDVVGDQFTEDYNGTPAGTSVEILESISWMERASVSTAISGGRSPEEDSEWVARGSARLRRLSSVLSTKAQFVEATLEDASVSMAVAIDNYNPTLPTPENSPGHITVVVYGNGGVVPNENKQRIQEMLTENASANLIVHVVDPTIVPVDITVAIKRTGTYDEQGTTANITEALKDYFNPNLSGWLNVIRRNEIIALVGSTPGVDYVDAITKPASDITLTGTAPLAELGTVTITYV
ncbi:baseplate J protein [Brevibacterium phage Cantare]|uniref:Baseplate J protein n=1 Tax=Brevibacterium phage Cantare TaxID=2338395 RepID=A0A3G3LYN9_9CAUD|nr:baseplate J protein [Brevibacterium phage Cantare]AYQ99250.1 baseplate J protein [Brevibacterium phage Cantare]